MPQLPAAVNYANPESLIPDIPTFNAPTGGGNAPAGGGGGMPVWLPAAITGGAKILSSIFGLKGQSDASKSQERMFNAAIGEQRRNQQMERLRLAAMWDAWNARRSELAARYGVSLGDAMNPFTNPTRQHYMAGERVDPGRNLGDLMDGGRYNARRDEWNA